MGGLYRACTFYREKSFGELNRQNELRPQVLQSYVPFIHSEIILMGIN